MISAVDRAPGNDTRSQVTSNLAVYELSPVLQRAAEGLLSSPYTPPRPEHSPEGRERIRRRKLLDQFKWEIGPRLGDATLANFSCDHPAQAAIVQSLKRYATNMAEEKRQGNGILLYGPSGTGKDHLLVALAKTAIVAHDFEVKRVFGVDLFSELRDRITDRALEEQWVVRLARPAILILSDPIPPRGSISDHQAAMLQRVVNKRWNQCKPTWVTMNVESAKQADELLAAAIVDRLKDGAVTAYCNWPSYRKQRRVL